MNAVSMDAESIVSILKVIGALIGGILGVTGVLANFRNAAGQLTAAGLVVLFGIAAAALVGVVTTIFESQRDKETARDQAARMEAVLREVSRSIQPIRHVRINYWFEIPQESEIVKAYIARLSKGVEQRIEQLRKFPMPGQPPAIEVKGLDAWAKDSAGEPLNIEITPESDLWPKDDEATIGVLTQLLAMNLDVFKKPVDVSRYAPVHGVSDFGALSVIPERSVLDWDIKRRKLFIVGDANFDKSLWKTNGQIASVIDLYGAQIVIRLAGSDEAPLPGGLSALRNEKQGSLLRSFILKTVAFDFGDGRGFWLAGVHFQKTQSTRGSVVFSLILPKSDIALRELGERDDDE